MTTSLVSVVIVIIVIAFAIIHRIREYGFVCAFRGHDIPENFLVMDLGAVFHGGICNQCKRFWLGEFLCNVWDDNKTEIVDNISHLRGTNPILKQGSWKMVGDVDSLQDLSNTLRDVK